MCVAENISKTVANIKSMYCRVTRGKGGTKKVCVYICVYMHGTAAYLCMCNLCTTFSSSFYYNLMSRDIFYRCSRSSFLLLPVFSINSCFFSTPGAA